VSGRAADQPPRPRVGLGTVVRLAVALGLTALILWKSHPSLVLEQARTAKPLPLVAAILLVVVDRTLMAWRWLWLLVPFQPDAPGATASAAVRPHAARPHVGLGAILHIFFVSTFVGTFLPASVGADAVRATSLARLGVPLADAVASVFMDRVLGVLAVLGMAVVGLWLASDLPARAAVLTSLAITAGGCAAVAAAVFSARIAALLVTMLERLPWRRVHTAGRSLIEAVQRYGTHHGLLALVTGASIGVQILRVLQAWCLGLSLGLAAPLPAYFAFIPIILLLMLLPITVNGLGTSQAGFWLFFGAVGVSPAGAFALSVLFVALGIVGNLPGVVLWARSGLTPAPAPSESTR
jgi:uncharacterized membrane protein YbhN (UPF0104 family)